MCEKGFAVVPELNVYCWGDSCKLFEAFLNFLIIFAVFPKKKYLQHYIRLKHFTIKRNDLNKWYFVTLINYLTF